MDKDESIVKTNQLKNESNFVSIQESEGVKENIDKMNEIKKTKKNRLLFFGRCFCNFQFVFYF